MRGIILKDLYEGFCTKKNTLNWTIGLIFISFLTAINSDHERSIWISVDRSTAVSAYGELIAANDCRAG